MSGSLPNAWNIPGECWLAAADDEATVSSSCRRPSVREVKERAQGALVVVIGSRQTWHVTVQVSTVTIVIIIISIIIIIIIIVIIIKGWHCKAGRECLTPYQSEDTSPTIPTH